MFLQSLIAVIGLVPLPVNGKQQMRAPGGPAPTLVVVRSVDDTSVTVWQPQTVVVPVKITTKVVVNGREGIKEETVNRVESRVMERKFALAGMRFYNGAGGKLTAADGRKNLTAGATILISANGQPVDPLYLRAVRPETLILVGPAARGVPAIGVGVPRKVEPPRKQP